MAEEKKEANFHVKNNSELSSNKSDSKIFLPLSIFSDDPSGLESVSKYLKDVLGMRYCAIADILNRDDRTIWDACRSATEKLNGELPDSHSSISIPISIFSDRSLSILEALTVYLKEELSMRYCGIASLLNKDQISSTLALA